MPQLIIPALTSAFAAAGLSTATGFLGVATLSAAGLAAQVTLTAGLLAVQFGLQSAQARQAKKRARRAQQGQTQTVRFPVEPRRRVYGELRTAGVLIFAEVRDGVLHTVSALHHGTIDGYSQFLINGREVRVDADGCVVSPPFVINVNNPPDSRSWVRLEWRRGFVSQPVLGLINRAFPEEWDATHTANGVALIAMTAREVDPGSYQRIYESTLPDVTAVMRGAPVHDPRQPSQSFADAETWRWSANPALCLLDYIRVFMRVAPQAVSEASFAAAADICDEFVPLKSGGRERRYTCAASYAFDENPAEVAQRLLDTMRGELYLDAQGRIALRLAGADVPAVTIGPDLIVSADYNARAGLLYEFNAVKAIFTSPAHGWQDQDAPLIENPDSVAELGRRVIDETRLPYVTSPTQAQRLAKIELYEDNPAWSGELTCHLGALALIGERMFRLVDPDMELDLTCRITGLTVSGDLSTVRVAFESIDPRAYAWDPLLDEKALPVLPPSTSDDPLFPAAPEALTAIMDEAGSDLVAGLRFAAQARAGQVHDIRWRVAGDTLWTEALDLAAPGHVTTALVDGETYEWQARVRTAQGGISPWATAFFEAAAPISTALAAPTGLALDGEAQFVRLSQSTDADAWAVQFAVSAEPPANFAGAPPLFAPPGQVLRHKVERPSGPWKVWARALSPSGRLISSVIGPLDLTIEPPPPPSESGGSAGDGGETGGGNGVGGLGEGNPFGGNGALY